MFNFRQNVIDALSRMFVAIGAYKNANRDAAILQQIPEQISS